MTDSRDGRNDDAPKIGIERVEAVIWTDDDGQTYRREFDDENGEIRDVEVDR